MGEVLLFTLSFVLGIAVPALIVRRDVARLVGEQLSRSWPDASLWAAVVVFGPISVPIHFLRTRRSLLGIGLAFVLVFSTLMEFALLQILVAILIGVVFGVLWGLFGPAKAPKSPPPEPVAVAAAPMPSRFDDITESAAPHDAGLPPSGAGSPPTGDAADGRPPDPSE